jgi:hypothetical protein
MGSKKAESNEITTGTDPSHITTPRATASTLGLTLMRPLLLLQSGQLSVLFKLSARLRTGRLTLLTSPMPSSMVIWWRKST